MTEPDEKRLDEVEESIKRARTLAEEGKTLPDSTPDPSYVDPDPDQPGPDPGEDRQITPPG